MALTVNVEDLPYVFHDPHKMDKKIDVKRLQFGSKIDSQESKREELFTVKSVLGADTIELNTGLTVKLLGIKPIPQFENEAVKFLQEKFKKRKVFLKYDSHHVLKYLVYMIVKIIYSVMYILTTKLLLTIIW